MRICPNCSQTFPANVTRCSRDGAALKLMTDPLVGRVLGGRYRLLYRLGTGGMSSVYLARAGTNERLMAVKMLRQDLAENPAQRDRFIREARAVNRVEHENIVVIYDFGESDDGLVYLVMEYVPGEPLYKLMGRGRFTSAQALDIVTQVAAALERIHSVGVVHRDLKPDNVLLIPRPGQRYLVKVVDFGIAKILDAPPLTGSQHIFGTPGYIAPEYIQSTKIDGRADFYSLGVILYEMVTGALPFDYEYPADLLAKHLREAPIPPRNRSPMLEPAVEQLIMRCLQKDPKDRFQDARSLLHELRSVQSLVGSPGRQGVWEPAHELKSPKRRNLATPLYGSAREGSEPPPSKDSPAVSPASSLLSSPARDNDYLARFVGPFDSERQRATKRFRDSDIPQRAARSQGAETMEEDLASLPTIVYTRPKPLSKPPPAKPLKERSGLHSELGRRVLNALRRL